MPRIHRVNRSNLYQHIFTEIPCATEFLESFENDASIYKKLNLHEYNEEVAELYEGLRKEFWRIVNTQLTDRQREVVVLYCQNLTQTEIAKKLNVNQSSITKSLNGNVDYSDKKYKTQYGGIIKKLIKIAETDSKILEILQKIRDLREDTWI